MNILTNEEKIWVDSQWEKLDKKLSKIAVRSREKIPFHSTDFMHDNRGGELIHLWTNGFWPGLMWLMYIGTKNDEYKKTAETTEKWLDEAMSTPERLGHDVGFMWRLASGPHYEIDKNQESWNRMRRAANVLMARYNPAGGFIRAWNWGATKGEKAGWTIIDTMMNLPLLYWASLQDEDPRFKMAAMNHTDKAMTSHVRPDGSVRHVVKHDPFTGEFIGEDETACQGYGVDSSWSRGQAWALYGFILGYIHTGKQEYLDTSKRVAHYFIANVCKDWLPRADFRSPAEPVYYDTSAAGCAACGLIEIAKIVPEFEKRMYLDAAISILKATEQFADWTTDTDYIIGMASGAYNNEQNSNFIFADYYYAEAIYKLKGFEPLFW
ncbi:MAG: glycoside hydrolase family 88 protein [Clostridia bacterium]|nr:glycoside hydrolase family 88 protein [Clostridia bacterium]